MKKILALALLTTSLWATENLGQNAEIVNCIEPEFVLQDFIAKSMVENQNQLKDIQ